MNVNLLRFVDRWVGTPLCLGLTLVRRLSDLLRRRTGEFAPKASPASRNNPPVVVIIKLAEMGSTVLALPALQRLREIMPGAKLHYLCLAENRSVLSILPGVEWEEVHGLDGRSAWTFVRDVLRAMRRLRHLRCDVAINLEFFSRGAAVLAYLSGAPTRVGMHRFHAEGLHCGDLFTHRISYNHHLHTSAAFLTLAEALNSPADHAPFLKERIDVPVSLPAFKPADEELTTVRNALREQRYPGESSPPILILNTNASDLVPLRRWPMERFEELGRRCLAERTDLWIALTGTAGEAPVVAELAARLGGERVINLAGRTTLRELLSLYTLADVMVTNDSGPGHFASLTSLRTVVLFGPETPELYGPLGVANRALHAGVACSPCIHVFNLRHSSCRDNVCMKKITVDTVHADVMRALNRSERAASIQAMA